MVGQLQEEKREVPEYKKRVVTELAKLMRENRTVMIASIKNVPAKQLQIIKKKIADKAKAKVAKKRLIIRAIENTGNEKLKELMPFIQENIIVIFSQLDPFELAAILEENKTPAHAKAGQIAPDNIVIHEGPTEFPPGPILSEFGNRGVKVAV